MTAEERWDVLQIANAAGLKPISVYKFLERRGITAVGRRGTGRCSRDVFDADQVRQAIAARSQRMPA